MIATVHVGLAIAMLALVIFWPGWHTEVQAAETNTWVDKNLPPELKFIFQNAQTIGGYYTGVTSTLEAVNAALNFLNGTTVPSQEQQFAMLHQHLDQIGIEIIQFVGSSFEDFRLADAQTALQIARQLVQEGRTVEVGSNADFFSLRAVNNAFKDSSFNRKLKGKPGLTWDWRVGLPHLMHVMGIRLNVLAAMEPEYRWSSRFDVELTRMHDQLWGIYDKMAKNVGCGEVTFSSCSIFGCSVTDRWVECVDRFSGAREWHDDHKFDQAELRRRLVRKMPFYDMRAMLDNLNLFRSGRADIAEGTREIAVSANPNFCIDIPNGARSAQVQLYACHGGGNQQWRYDRHSGAIVNLETGRCLDVQWNAHAPGTPVWTWECNGHDAQRWTYDVYSQVLESAVGLALQITGNSSGSVLAGNVANHTPLVIWPRNNLAKQQWIP